MRLLPIVLASLTTSAWAGTVPLWNQDTFSGSQIAGSGGWETGFSQDRWTASRSGNSLLPQTDYNDGDFQGPDGFGRGGPSDNWLCRGADFEDGGIVVQVGNLDNDAAGVVLRQSSTGYYLLLHTSNAGPEPLGNVEDPTLAIIRVEGRNATVLAEVRAPTALGETPVELRLNVNDNGSLTGIYNRAPLIRATDPQPLPAGRAGVWAYDCGVGFDGNTCFFDSVEAYRLDDDDDGVADDDDNCERAPNFDQLDADSDGIGNACDPDYVSPNPDTDLPTDTDVPVDSDGNPVVDTDGDPTTDTDGGPVGGDPSGGPGGTPGDFLDEDLLAACAGCNHGSAPAAWWLLLLAPFVARRRRS